MPLYALYVNQGDKVVQGQEIAEVGSTETQQDHTCILK